MASFLESLQLQARSRPQAPAVVSAQGTLSYEALLARAAGIARVLAESGLKRGDVLVLKVSDPLMSCSAIVATIASGITTLSIAGQLSVLPKAPAATAILTDQGVAYAGPVRVLKVGPDWLSALPTASGFPAPSFDTGRDILRVAYTSGTTGEQKAVPFTKDQLLQRVGGQVAGLGPLTSSSRVLSMVHEASGQAFSHLMLVLMAGGTQMFVSGFPELASVSSQVDRLLVSTGQLIAMLRGQDDKTADFSAIGSIVVGGSHIPPSVAKRAQAICRDIICLYGSTEMGAVATAPVEAIIARESAVGFVVPGVRVEIVDEGGNVVGFDREGIIRVNVPDAPDHYLGDPVTTRRVFRDGWFYPGDLGSLSERGLLCVSGRVSERINVGGLKVSPTLIENVITERAEISDAAAFELVNDEGIGDIAVFVVFDGNIDLAHFDRAEFARWVQKKLRRFTPKRWFVVKEIPRTAQGKIDRAALPRLAKNRSTFQSLASLEARQTGAS